MKKKSLVLSLIAVLALVAAAIWMFRPQPSKIGLVNFPQFMAARMSLSADAANVKISMVDDLSKMKDFDAILCFGMGAKWTDEDRDQFALLDKKKVPYMVFSATNPQNNLCSIDSIQAEELSKYIGYGGALNYRSGFNYLRKEILQKELREGSIEAPIEYANDLLFGKTDSDIFESVEGYLSYYKNKGYREAAPRVALLIGFGNPFNSNREHIDEIVASFEASGLNVFPISAGAKRLAFLQQIDPDLLVYMPHGRIAPGRSTEVEAWLKEKNIPVITALTINGLRENWEQDKQGMVGGFMAQSVSTPELDGAMLPFALVALEKDEKTGLQLFKTIPGRLEVFTRLINKHIALKQKTNKDKRIAIYYFKGPGQNSLVAQGLETLPSIYNVLKQMQAEGYNVSGLPDNLQAFEELVMKQGAIFNSYAEGSLAKFSESGYPAFVAADTLRSWMNEVLTAAQIAALKERYGEAPGEYYTMQQDGEAGLGVTRIEFGNIALLPQPVQSTGANDFKAVHGSNPVPPYAYIASYLWSQRAFQADALLHFGTHGSLEFIPGKQIALSSEDWTDRLVNDLPHVYYYTIANIGEAMMAKRRSYAATVSYLAPPFMETKLRGEVEEFLKLTDQYLASDQDNASLGLKIKELAVKRGYHRDLKLDSLPQTPYNRQEITSLSDFVEELASSKITGGMYKTGEAFAEEKLRSSIKQICTDPIAYALAAIDRLRGRYSQKQQDSERFFTLHYRRPASLLVERHLGSASIAVDAALASLGISPMEIAKSKAFSQTSDKSPAAMQERMMAGAGGRMPTASEMAQMRAMAAAMKSQNQAASKEDKEGAQAPSAEKAEKMKRMKEAMAAMGKSEEEMAESMKRMQAAMAKQEAAAEGEAAMPSKMPMQASAATAAKPKAASPIALDPKKLSPADKAMAAAVNELARAIAQIPVYYRDLKESPRLELKAFVNALAGGFTPPSPGGDYIANPQALPTGRNLYSINAEATPTADAWEKGRKMGDDMLADYAARHDGKLPQKVSFTLWSSSFIESEGATIAEILYLLGTEPVRDPMGRVMDIRLIPLEELGRKRIDVVVQTSGQLRDLAASRLYLIQKAVDLAAAQKDEADNEVAKGAVDAERVLLEKGLSPADARLMATQRVFGGVNGNYGTGIQEMVESGDRWENEKEIADVYLNNMGAIYGLEGRWGDFKAGMFEAALQHVDAVVQPRQSNTWGALSLDHVYEFMGGLNLSVRQVTGKDPEAYFNDLRNKHKTRVQELKQAIGVEARTTILNPAFLKEQLKEGQGAANGLAETIRNTYGWNVKKPKAIDKELWEDIYATFINDVNNLGVQEFFRQQNPAAMQEITAVMMETVRKGMWKATPEQMKRLAEVHAQSLQEAGAGCSGFVCDNAKLRDFIGKSLDAQSKKAYDEQISKAREQSIDSKEGQRLKKEQQSSEKNPIASPKLLLPIAVVLLLIVLILFFRAKRHKQRG